MTRSVVNLIACALLATPLVGCRMDDGGSVTVATATTTPAPTQTSAPPKASATPTPDAGLAAPGKLARLHIEADANPPAGEDCERLFPFAMTSTSASAPGRLVECGFSKTFALGRYQFTPAADGSLYLERVEFLLRAKTSADAVSGLSKCADIREHLVAADQPAENATRVIVCWQAPPLPSGTAGGSNVVWAGVPEDAAQIRFPERTYCWQLVPYLGPPREVRTVPVPCVLD